MKSFNEKVNELLDKNNERTIALIESKIKLALKKCNGWVLTLPMDILILEYCVINNDLNLVPVLLKTSNQPEYNKNHNIIRASQLNLDNMVKLLWNDQRVKNTLKKDDQELYNKLIIQDVKNKVSVF